MIFARTPFLFVGILLLVVSISPTALEATTVGANTCTTIDREWTEYNRKILGANEKITDVVLNACRAIGGGCVFASGKRTKEQNDAAGGAQNSQHLQGTAIDLTVPPGKEVEFMTLAICGLRRVNNCQGGLGYYANKSIHVDTRTHSNAVWSNGFRRSGIANNVSDSSARSLLHGFGDGKCTDGSIQGDYSDEKIYGPPVQYEPPAGVPPNIIWYPTVDPTTVYASLIGRQIGYGLTQMFQRNNSGQSTLGASNIVYRDAETATDDTDALPPESDLLSDDSSKTQALLDSFLSPQQEETREQQPVGGQNPTEECRDEFSGSGVLQDCGSQRTQTQDGIVTTIEQVEPDGETGFVENILTRVFQGADFTFDDEGSVQRVRTGGGGVDVFYGVHTPRDEQGSQSVQFDNNIPGYTQFNTGEVRPVVRETPEIVTNSIRFVELSTRLGAYYGLMHGVSPLVIGSAPRTFVRFVQGTGY